MRLYGQTLVTINQDNSYISGSDIKLMTGRISSHSKRLIISLLILLGFSSTSLFSQKNLSGNINQPKSHVVTIGVDRVTVDDVTGFNNGDTILLIQMQGVRILTAPLGAYGTVQNKFGEPGMWEFLIIQTVIGDEIVFRNDLLKSYDPQGNIQIVRVPYYNSAIVTGNLYCDQWSPTTKSGGVLALIIGRTLKLNADIDVTGRGFLGGKEAIGDGICWNTSPGLYGLDYYAQNFTNAGFKGEGLAIHNDVGTLLEPLYMKGMGPNFTGGGGGNGRYSGGGGGSNRGEGGLGGSENCSPPWVGGKGGFKADHVSLIDRIYLGGGGGASTTSLTGTSSYGGNGGGLVIVVADTIIGNGGNVLSNGSNGGNGTGIAGSGGGGAAGSVALSLNSYGQDTIKFYLKGGKGGDNPGTSGEGGGGGGGLLWVSTTVTSNVKKFLDGGASGESGATNAFPGNPGENRTGFKANLNGFLFNSIRSSVTGDQIDYVCSNMLPPMITGTKPVGGKPDYTYKWEKSYNKNFVPKIDLVNDPDPTNYIPTVLEISLVTDTVWFRRIITDSSPTPLVDLGKPVMIIIQPAITFNDIGKDTIICYNQDPIPLVAVPGLAGGNGIDYAFRWQNSHDNITFANINGATNPIYDPPALPVDSLYRRIVTSGACVDISDTVKITVLDTLKNNKILNSSPDICYGMTFPDLLATTAATTPALGGGDNLYRFKWESSTNGTTWITATGVSNGVGYNPDELSSSFPGNEYYRRVVKSGIHDVCINTSTPVLLKDFPVITNNTITANQIICSGSAAPSKLIGSVPLNGNGIYTYTWQDSTKSHIWTDIPGAINILSPDYQPPPLTDTTRYRRIVFSSACSDISKSIIVNVHKPIVNNIASLISGPGLDTTICSGAVPDSIMGSIPTGGTDISNDYAYLWEGSITSAIAGFSAAPGANTKKSYKPGVLTQPTWFRRKVISGVCSNESNPIRVIVLPPITNNFISGDQTICPGSTPSQITGPALSGGAGGIPTWIWQESSDGLIWTAATGIGNQQNYSPPLLTAPMKYRRIILSGLSDCCRDTSNEVTISIHPPLPTGEITSTAPITICEGSKVPLDISLTGVSPWKVIYNENSTQVTVNNITAPVTTLLASPVTGTALTTFNYSLFSVEDKNGCKATSTSLTGTRKAVVYKVPTAIAGPAADTCGPTVTLKAIPSVGTGTWYYPAAVIVSTINSSSSVTVTVDSTFADGNIAHKFYWEEVNWQCKNKDSVIITFDKRVSSINAGPDTSLFSFDNIIHMVADPVLAWETGLWTVVSGTGDFDDNSKISAEVRNLSKGINKFLWTLTNGTCKLEDFVNIDVYDLVIPEGFSPNNDPGNFNNTFIITGLDLPNQISELTVVNGAGTEVFSTSNNDSQAWTDWDGKNSKGLDLPEGTYYYLLKITSKGNGQVFKRSGFIVLKRY